MLPVAKSLQQVTSKTFHQVVLELLVRKKEKLGMGVGMRGGGGGRDSRRRAQSKFIVVSAEQLLFDQHGFRLGIP